MLNANLSPQIHGSMAWTLLLGFVALTLVFVWMLLVRYRIGVLEDWLAANELDLALAERQSEGPRRVRCPGRSARPTTSRPAGGGGLMRYVDRRVRLRPRPPRPLRRRAGLAPPAPDAGRVARVTPRHAAAVPPSAPGPSRPRPS